MSKPLTLTLTIPSSCTSCTAVFNNASMHLCKTLIVMCSAPCYKILRSMKTPSHLKRKKQCSSYLEGNNGTVAVSRVTQCSSVLITAVLCVETQTRWNADDNTIKRSDKKKTFPLENCPFKHTAARLCTSSWDENRSMSKLQFYASKTSWDKSSYAV